MCLQRSLQLYMCTCLFVCLFVCLFAVARCTVSADTELAAVIYLHRNLTANSLTLVGKGSFSSLPLLASL